MKKYVIYLLMLWTGILILAFLTGCSERKKTQSELAVGNWTQLRNKTYVLLILSSNGQWQSSVRIMDATSKVVRAKGDAKGVWNIEKEQMIFTVFESDIEEIWQKNATVFHDIVDLTEDTMQLMDESGRILVWDRTRIQKFGESEVDPAFTAPMAPVVVNLNKNRSADKDQYLCLKMNLVFNEPVPGQSLSFAHPRIHDAAIIFLSSLVFDDVKDFDSIRVIGQNLVHVLNPYLEGLVKEIEIKHVIVSTEVEKVEEFMIEHTISGKSLPQDGGKG